MTLSDDLKNLAPEERIKKLKEIEEKDKKEIEEASKLIKDSESEILHEKKIKEQIPIPQLKALDITSLFSEDEKEMYASKHFIDKKTKNGLEKKLKQQALENIDENERDKLLKELNTQDLYNLQKDIYQQAGRGELNPSQQANFYAIQEEFDERREAMEHGIYKPTNEAVRDILSLTESMHRHLYRR